MKLICTEYNNHLETTFSIVGDNALLRNNNDFYLPSFSDRISCVPQLVLKVSKLGKGISERFASRYYQEIGVGIRFYADSLMEDLIAKHLPVGVAFSFDESAAISPMKPFNTEEYSYQLRVNGDIVIENLLSRLPSSPDQILSRASFYYMLKTGDYIFCGDPSRYEHLRIGNHLEMFLNGEKMLDFFVR